MPKYDVAIIGSGLGGLLCGSILTREGFNVVILEKNPQPGGCLQSYRRDGHIFDTGIHYIGSLDNGQILDRYFKYFGIRDKLNLKRMDEHAMDIIQYSDGSSYQLGMGYDNYKSSLLEYFPKERLAIEKYLLSMQSLCKSFPLYNLNARYEGFKQLSELNINAYQFFSELTSNTRLQNVLAATNFNYGGISSKSPFYVHSLITNSFIDSSWRLVDGSGQIATLLADQIMENGGTIRSNAKVTAIKFKSQADKIASLVVNGRETIEAEWVISDIHPSNTLSLLSDLYPVRLLNERLEQMENTLGAFTLNGYFKRKSFPYLNSNYFFHPDENPWYDLTSGIKNTPGSFVFLTPSYSNCSDFADTFTIMTAMDFELVKKWEHTKIGNRGKEYLDLKGRYAEHMVEIVDNMFPGFRSKIERTYTSTPLSWQDYTGTPRGSMYGILKDSNDPLRTMVFPKNRIPNLLFTGQNIILHGVIGVTIGVVQTCSEIIGMDYLVDKIIKAS
jgi:all-trans-retinol 13,14-reductase